MKNSVTVFCGAQSGRADIYVHAAAGLGTAIAQANLRLVYGGAALELMGVAERLQLETLREVRWKNDRAISRAWQHDYESPLLPHRSSTDNTVASKLIDSLGILGADFTDAAEVARRRDGLVTRLSRYGVHTEAGDQDA